MRHTPRVTARRWLVLAVAVLITLPAATPALAAPTAPAALPHAVGGFIPSKVPTSAKSTLGAHVTEDLPASVDLREFAPAVGNQGQIGACVAWTIGYSIMGYYANRNGGVGAPYAPLFLYMRNVAKGGAPKSGLIADNVLANAQAAGVDTQADYWQGTTNWQAAPTSAEIEHATNYRVSGWNRLFNGTNQGAAAQTTIMQALAAGKPVALGIPVYRDFMYLSTHSLYNTLSGSNLGGHMIAVYGYDAEGIFIRNSWGTAWGNSGDAKISWGFVTRQATSAFAVSGITTPDDPIPMAPSVGALSTARGATGASVTITGAHLANATTVRFGDSQATFTPVTTDGTTKLTAIVPARATGSAVDVTVSNATGVSATSTASKFTYAPAPPAITALSPSSASVLGGTTVTLTGTSLTGVTAVRVGTATAPAKSVTPTSLTFVVPPRTAGAVAVTVTNTYGTSTPAGELTYTNPPAPTVTGIAPSSGLTHKVTQVLVTGTDLTGATKVTLDGAALTFTKVSATQLRVNLPAHPVGDAELQVTAPGGTSTVDTASTFTYRAPPEPAITAITPSTGPTYLRTAVKVTGVNLTDASKLTVDGVSVVFTKVSDTELKVVLPVHATGAADLQVTTPGGETPLGSDTQFTYVGPPAPEVGWVVPWSGLTTQTNIVVLTGTDLGSVSKVTANGTSVTWSKISDSQVRVTLPPRAAGDVDLVVTTPGGTSTAVTFTSVAPPAPVITSLSVTKALTKVSTPLKIIGTGLTGTTRVTVGGVPATFANVSATELRVTAPAFTVGGQAPVVVTTPGGASEPAAFTYLALALPSISELRPAAGPAYRSTVVFVVGSGFTGATKLTLGGSPVSFSLLSDTVAKATLPAKAAGTYQLAVVGPIGTSASGTTNTFEVLG